MSSEFAFCLLEVWVMASVPYVVCLVHHIWCGLCTVCSVVSCTVCVVICDAPYVAVFQGKVLRFVLYCRRRCVELCGACTLYGYV